VTIESASLKISALLAASSAVLQSSTVHTPGIPIASLLVPIVSAVVGGLMSYAVLRTTVHNMEREVRDMRKDMSEIYALVRESLTKVAKLEGRLDSHS
jgi:phosphoribosylcarboxyaminoimidazole (NCAIR) mutase